MIRKLNFPSIICLLCIMMLSCVPYREVKHFNDVEKVNLSYTNVREQKKIAPFDNLYIRVLSIDEKTAQIFNSQDNSRNSGNNSLISYMVDEKGNIEFPFVGNINVAGITTAEANVKIEKALKEYLSATTAVVVRFVDNKVTLLGEVQRPGQYPFTQDKITIYDALGLAGGFTRFGNHHKVILVREENNKITHYKLDLSNSKIAGTEFFYLLPNDVIVVEPLKAVSYSYLNMTFSTILSTVTTLLAILVFANVKL